MDPGILNDWLREHRGFGHCSQDPVGDCCLAWDGLPEGVELTFHANRSEIGLNAVSTVVIDHALRSGEPVVAGVHWDETCRAGSSQTEDCHWIVLTGKIGDTYTIVDPINLDPADPKGVRTTLDRGTRGAYIIDRFVVVSPGPGTATSLPRDTAPTREPSGEREAFTAVAILGLLAIVGIVVAAVLLSSR
jgi:hypothetical protein